MANLRKKLKGDSAGPRLLLTVVPEAVVRHIPLVPLLALLITLANFTIFLDLFT